MKALRKLKMKPEGRNLEVLTHAAKIGYKDKTQLPIFQSAYVLYFHKDGDIGSYYGEEYYKKHSYPEISVNDFLKLGTRFKTEQEFKEEFGDDWRKKLKYSWNEIGYMDYLFGKDYTKEVEKEWCISTDMLTTDPLPEKEVEKEAVKKDAYIDKDDAGKWYVKRLTKGKYRSVNIINNAYRYNILSKGDYQKKYPLLETAKDMNKITKEQAIQLINDSDWINLDSKHGITTLIMYKDKEVIIKVNK